MSIYYNYPYYATENYYFNFFGDNTWRHQYFAKASLMTFNPTYEEKISICNDSDGAKYLSVDECTLNGKNQFSARNFKFDWNCNYSYGSVAVSELKL